MRFGFRVVALARELMSVTVVSWALFLSRLVFFLVAVVSDSAQCVSHADRAL